MTCAANRDRPPWSCCGLCRRCDVATLRSRCHQCPCPDSRTPAAGATARVFGFAAPVTGWQGVSDLNRAGQVAYAGYQLTHYATANGFRARTIATGKSTTEYDLKYPSANNTLLDADLYSRSIGLFRSLIPVNSVETYLVQLNTCIPRAE